ncbi:MAG: exosortase/archaeosortase family protein [Planctomycetia bacterium]|nr:exosortase/archaeosortase family protein [Planctomycetia bacterium]
MLPKNVEASSLNVKQDLSRTAIALLAVLFLTALIWSYWTTLTAMAYKWWNDPQYSQGYLVPFFSLVILYLRRDRLEKITATLDPRGLILVILGMLIHVACGFINQDWIDGISLMIVIAGLFWLFGGWSIMWWALPAVMFLIFMIPLPHSVETGLAYPLQRIATIGSLFLIQASGIPAVAEGNVIFLSQSRIGVMEACSGLSMLLIFFALAAAMVVIYRPPILDTVIIILSAIPIAIIVNILRITATGIAQEWFGEEAAEKIFHDWAGWLMMPVALGFLALEIWLLRKLVPVQDVSTHKHAGAASIQATRKRLIGRR